MALIYFRDYLERFGLTLEEFIKHFCDIKFEFYFSCYNDSHITLFDKEYSCDVSSYDDLQKHLDKFFDCVYIADIFAESFVYVLDSIDNHLNVIDFDDSYDIEDDCNICEYKLLIQYVQED